MELDLTNWDKVSTLLLVLISLTGLWIWSMRIWFKDPQTRVQARRIGVALCMGALYLLVADAYFGPNGRWAIVFVVGLTLATLKLLGIHWFDIDRILPPAEDPVSREIPDTIARHPVPEPLPRNAIRFERRWRERAQLRHPPPEPGEQTGKILKFPRRSGTE